MAGTFEIDQATGARSSICAAKEADWGVLNPSANWKQLNVLAGETLDQNLTRYRSGVMRKDRGRNRGSRGSEKPGGSLPFELAPRGASQFFYYALGNLVSSTGTGLYTHVLKRSITALSLPSFTVEKSANDIPVPLYAGILGCRVNGFNINWNGDAMASGSFDIMGREFYHGSTSKIVGTPTDQTSDGFTSVQASIYEQSSLVLLGTILNFSLSFSNNLYGDNIRLGSNKRINLKPGECSIDFNGRYAFNSYDLYDRATSGLSTVVEILVDNGTYLWQCLLPQVELYPSNSLFKIDRPGPMEASLTGEAQVDTTTQNTDMVITITSPESNISN